MSLDHEGLSTRFIEETLGLSTRHPFLFFNEVVVDSRRVQEGDLFVALRGGQRDGHDFIDDAVARGAAGVLCEKSQSSIAKSVPILECNDTLKALSDLARAWRGMFDLPVIAVVGSVGKTSTKEFLAAILAKESVKVLKTLGNQNGDIGLPLTLLRLRSHHEIAVLEIGIDAPGAMEQHVNLAIPTAAICTAISPEHMEKLSDLETVAREELICLDRVIEKGGVVAINCDDPWIQPKRAIYPSGLTHGFSLAKLSTNGDRGILHGRFSPPRTLIINESSENEKAFILPLPGVHHARNALGAIALGLGLGRSLESMLSGIELTEVQPGRCETHVLPSNVTVLCDYYNASPASMVSGLQTTVLLSGPDGRRIACLGDMLELGKDEEKFHRDLAVPLRDLGFSVVLTLGPRMRWVVDELSAQSFEGLCRHFDTHDAMNLELERLMKAGDTVLLKGSRSMNMELIWSGLRSWRSGKPTEMKGGGNDARGER